MSSTADQLSALGNDQNFKLRIQSLAIQAATTVYAEAPATPDTRRNFAKQILSNASIVQNLASIIANRTNLVAGNTTYDFSTGHIKTDVTDAAISSQIASDWNMLAGV